MHTQRSTLGFRQHTLPMLVMGMMVTHVSFGDLRGGFPPLSRRPSPPPPAPRTVQPEDELDPDEVEFDVGLATESKTRVQSSQLSGANVPNLSEDLEWEPHVQPSTMLVEALQGVLLDPTTELAVTDEVLIQLSTNRPIAFVGGFWVTPIDLTRVYALPTIHEHFQNQCVDLATVVSLNEHDRAASRLALAFTPSHLSPALLAGGDSETANALGMHFGMLSTDVSSGSGVVVVASAPKRRGGIGKILFYPLVWTIDCVLNLDDCIGGGEPGPFDSGGDMDCDLIPNEQDADDDGDGVPDTADQFPFDACYPDCHAQACKTDPCTGVNRHRPCNQDDPDDNSDGGGSGDDDDDDDNDDDNKGGWGDQWDWWNDPVIVVGPTDSGPYNPYDVYRLVEDAYDRLLRSEGVVQEIVFDTAILNP